ncbi:hypothetical protein [Sinorhizobium meliloti]|uniref:hypothetical protein n=1 Tax=Rhizobium meliloti TaxID=382 RepID=UPI000FDC7F42|nr:hypothetical protein [Sinorhizobium meliloti]RVI43663.1 hypothetical protein CN195_28205 [Sinorhizobium meliloti]
MARAGTATTYNPETGRHETYDEWREWKDQQDREKQQAVQHSAPVTQVAAPPAKDSSAFYKTIGRHLGQRFAEEAGKIRAEMRKALDDLVRERHDGLDDIHADYRQLKADIDFAVNSKIADALRLERQKRAQIELKLERALDDIEKLQQQLDGSGLYEVGGRAK